MNPNNPHLPIDLQTLNSTHNPMNQTKRSTSHQNNFGVMLQQPKRRYSRGLAAGVALGFLAILGLGSSALALPLGNLPADSQKQLAEGAGEIVAMENGGARLVALLQDLEAEATPEGLWMVSKAEEDAGKENKFRVRAMALGREELAPLPKQGKVRAEGDLVSWTRDGVVEEYRVTGDGVRQDFLVAESPAGEGPLVLELDLEGVRASEAAYGAELELEATGRVLAYHRLLVTDAKGRELPAKMQVASTDSIRLEVDDAAAVYPVRIDPTFSDSDWMNMNSGEWIVKIYSIAVDPKGFVYVGGYFKQLSPRTSDEPYGKIYNNIAKWDGSKWSPLGFKEVGITSTYAGVGVRALALDSKGNLYVGGRFDRVGGIPVNNVAIWNGTSWSALGAGVGDFNATVHTLVVDEKDDLYVGGQFQTAGGVFAINIVKWDGVKWVPLGGGLSGGINYNSVFDLEFDRLGNLYVCGDFEMAGNFPAKYIAIWNGIEWRGLSAEPPFSRDYIKTIVIDKNGNIYAGRGENRSNRRDGSDRHAILKWTGKEWISLGSGVERINGSYISGATVKSLAVDKNNNLYAGGDFNKAGDVVANFVAKWNGTTWSALGSGLDREVHALALDENGTLYVGGIFDVAGGKLAAGIAKVDFRSPQSITFTAPGRQVFSLGKTLKLAATASSRLPVTFSSGNTSVASIQKNVLTIRGAGTVQITANQIGNTAWKPASPVVRTLVVGKGSQKIVFGKPIDQSFKKNKTFTLDASSTAKLGVVFKSSNPQIVSIKGRTAKILLKGKVTITASQPGNQNWNAAKDVKRTLTIK